MGFFHLALMTVVALASTEPLSLDEAIRQAVAAQPLLQSFKQQKLAARARVTQAASIEYPQVNAVGQALEATGNTRPLSYLSMPDFAAVGAQPAGSAAAGAPYAPAFSSIVGLGAHYQVLDFGY